MRDNVIVAVDAMGGDAGPGVVISALDILCDKLLKKVSFSFYFKIYGDIETISPILKKTVLLSRYSQLIHASETVLHNDKPSLVLRKRKDSSMHKAVLAVSVGDAHCVVSSGNTGALMVISKVILGTLPEVYRAALVTTFPYVKGEFVMLDLGANVDSNSEVLFKFGVMGTAFCQSIMGRQYPRVGLLNIGAEEEKGTDTIKEAYHLFRANEDKINFIGYVEPHAVLTGAVEVDVVVSDGFSGNLVLKMAEGVFYMIKDSIKKAMSADMLSKFLSPIVFSKLKNALSRFDPSVRNGAMLIGLNGIIVKAHGSSDVVAFMNATEVAINAVIHDMNQQIISVMDKISNYES